MSGDVQILLFLIFPLSLASDFGLQFTLHPVQHIIATPGSNIQLICSVNIKLPLGAIAWHCNNEPLPSPLLSSAPIDSSNTNVSDAYEIMYETKSFPNGSSTLDICVPSFYNSTSWQQIAMYQCIATLGTVRVASDMSQMEIAGMAPYTADRKGSRTDTFGKGGVAVISCPPASLFSVPPPVIAFSKDNVQLDLHDSSKVVRSVSGDLIMLSVSDSSFGVYQCSATNSLLNRTVVSSPVFVTDVKQIHASTPKLIYPTKSFNIKVREGAEVVIPCAMEGLTPSNSHKWQLYWTIQYRYNSSSKLPHKELIKNTGTFASVINIKRASTGDTGFYQCVMESLTKGEESNDRVTVSLQVLSGPRLLDGLSSAELCEGQRLQVRCAVSGHTAPLLWLSNGVKLQDKPGAVSINPNGTLNIDSVSKDFAGVLQCFAWNNLGSVSSQAFYTVLPSPVKKGSSTVYSSTSKRDSGSHPRWQGREQTPGRPSVRRLADDAVEVSWQPPADTSRLLFYKVQYREVSTGDTSTTKHQTLLGPWHRSGTWHTHDTVDAARYTSIVVGLTAGSVYKFRVAAAVQGSDSRISASSDRFLLTAATPLTAPTAPPTLQSVSWSGSDILVRWHFVPTAVETDGFIISYSPHRPHTSLTSETELRRRVYWTGSTLRYLSGNRRQVVIPNIRRDPLLFFRIQAFNMAGNSPFSRPLKLRLSGEKFYNGVSLDQLHPSVEGSGDHVTDDEDYSDIGVSHHDKTTWKPSRKNRPGRRPPMRQQLMTDKEFEDFVSLDVKTTQKMSQKNRSGRQPPMRREPIYLFPIPRTTVQLALLLLSILSVVIIAIAVLFYIAILGKVEYASCGGSQPPPLYTPPAASPDTSYSVCPQLSMPD